MKLNQLKNKKILITAGPTWIPIDKVRIITNIFTGRLGAIIAKEAIKRNAKVTLLLGPSPICLPLKKSPQLRIIRFKFFKELFKIMKKEIRSKNYDVVIHSAAVGDFEPVKFYHGKISSQIKNLVLKLKPTPKIVDEIKKWDPKVFLVKFKVEANLRKNELIKRAYESMLSSNADLMVANDLKDITPKKHKAFIIDRKKNIIKANTKEEIAKKLLNVIARNYEGRY